MPSRLNPVTYMKRVLFPLFAAIAMAGTSAHATFECFLELQGVQGESTAEGHTNDITIESIAFEISNSPTGVSQGSDVVLTKLLDKASPLLALKAADGTYFPDAKIICRSSDAGRPIFYRITLWDVGVSRIALAGANVDNRPRESVSLRYSRIQWEYWPILPDGTPGTVVRRGWDFAAKRPV